MDFTTKTITGFSLLETMITIGIVSILVSLAIPGYQTISAEIRGRTAVQSVKQSILNARNQALTKNQNIKLCASEDGVHCSKKNQWQTGWISYVNLSSETYKTADDLLLSTYPALKNIIIKKNGLSKTIGIKENGRISLNSSFSLCHKKRNQPIARIVMIHSGRIRVDQKRIDCE